MSILDWTTKTINEGTPFEKVIAVPPQENKLINRGASVMNYQLVSIATILRDYIDVKNDVGYKNNEHEQLVDIADGIYNGGTKVDTMTPEYQKIYATETPEFWTLVFKDIKALDSQVSSHNVHDLLDDYKELLK